MSRHISKLQDLTVRVVLNTLICRIFSLLSREVVFVKNKAGPFEVNVWMRTKRVRFLTEKVEITKKKLCRMAF